MANRIVTLPGVSLITAIELLLINRASPESLPVSISPRWLGVTIAIFNLFFYIAWIVWIHPCYFHPLRNFPAPKVLVLWKAYTRLKGSVPGQLFLDLANKHKNNDGILVMQGHRSNLLLLKPAPLADVLVHHPYDFVKFDSVRDFLRPILGDGLVVVEGEQHRFLRKNTQPAFNFRHIKELYPMMWKKAGLLMDTLRTEAQGKERLEMQSWASKVTLDIIGIAGLGREFNVLKNPDDSLVTNFARLLQPSKEKFMYLLLVSMFGHRLVQLLPWNVGRTFKETTSNIRTICRQLVRDKKVAIEKHSDHDHFDILSLLIKSNNFSEGELVDQLLTFLAAGHETTSSIFTWTCYLLAISPKYQAALRDEVQTALSAANVSLPGSLHSDTDLAGILEHLPYLNGIMHETLRLYPTVPITVRVATRDTTLMGHAIEEGTEIFIVPWATNRYTEIWGADAGEFKPERWIDTDQEGNKKVNHTGGAASNYAQMTFLHGPRSCIGQNFAKAELRCLLAALVTSFEWELGMDEKDVFPGGVITIRPANGLFVKLRPLR
ncbi:cytochrome P450 [Diplogelasinospora grovesii]|uniref:Cytochrome P450 n=1 Tax=Diplogelasinospora grovesii TaxID=303347 RepID=A0AAN6MYB6_9PEZI|nr:cytochrome P450 [Diplogelasinospora grovesii]